MAEAALATGADGYILKSDSGDELLPAIEAIIEGKQFISARLAGDVAKRNDNVSGFARTCR